MVETILSSESLFHPRIIKNVHLESERCVIPSLQPAVIAGEPLSLEEQTEIIVGKAKQEAEQILKQAYAEAEKLLQQTRQDASTLLHESESKIKLLEEQAYKEGLNRGETQALDQLKQTAEIFQTVLKEAQAERQRLLSGTEAEAVQLILAIVRKILKIEPIINEQVILKVTRAALQRLSQARDVEIHVHPADLELVHFNLSLLQDLTLEIVLEPDEKIAPGGCLIKSRSGSIDATIDSQFETVACSFLTVAEG
jgi:flagellar assembly protein FliH